MILSCALCHTCFCPAWDSQDCLSCHTDQIHCSFLFPAHTIFCCVCAIFRQWDFNFVFAEDPTVFYHGVFFSSAHVIMHLSDSSGMLHDTAAGGSNMHLSLGLTDTLLWPVEDQARLILVLLTYCYAILVASSPRRKMFPQQAGSLMHPN